jgi:NAD(P)H dehydrogenase (quinone)
MTRILIAFYSRTGSVERLANAISEGAVSAGAEVRVRRARELVDKALMASVPGWAEEAERMNAAYEAPHANDADWADGIAFGSPTRFGTASSELRAFIETLGPLWFQGKLFNKAGAVFTSTSAPAGGTETTILTQYPTLAHLGLVIVPTGYGHPTAYRAGTPYGASSHSHGQKRVMPTEDDLELARYQGKRLAQVAEALKTVRANAG